MIDYLSASGIKKFQECPRAFWFKYLSDVEPVEEGEVKHFEAGNAVHESIEEVVQEQPDLLDDQDVLLELLREKERSLDFNYGDKSSQVQDCLENAAKYISKLVREVEHVEDRWEMTKDGIDYVGYADLVADIEDEERLLENTIVDWKTGEENDLWKEKVQGGVYLEMFHNEHGYYPDAIDFVYLKDGTRSVHRRISDGEVRWNEHENKYWTQIEEYINDIRLSDQKDDWPAEGEGSTCYFCDHKFACSGYIGSENLNKKHVEMQL